MRKIAIIGSHFAALSLALQRTALDAGVIVVDDDLLPKEQLDQPIPITARVPITALSTIVERSSKRQLNKPHKHEYTKINSVWKCRCGQTL